MKFRSIPVSRKDGKALPGSLCTDHLPDVVGLFAGFKTKAVLLHPDAVAARRIVEFAWETRELQLFKTLDALLNANRTAVEPAELWPWSPRRTLPGRVT
jgi:hypothetical protein